MPVRIATVVLTGALLFAQSGAPIRIGQNIGAGEGPVWRDGYLWFTGGGRISRRNDATGTVEVWKDNAGGANGLRFDPQGRLVVCEGLNRRVVRYNAGGGEPEVLADSYNGRKLNSPNDLTLDSHGRIYFSDPRYGRRDGMEQPEEAVYRIDAPGQVTKVIGKSEGVDRPNGLAITPDGKFIYVADNNNSVGGVRALWRFDLRANGTVDVRSRKHIHNWGTGRGPDGMKIDSAGNLYVAAGRTKPRLPDETADAQGGVYVFRRDGKLLRILPVTDDEVTNCAFGGADGNTLFITAGGNLWSIRP